MLDILSVTLTIKHCCDETTIGYYRACCIVGFSRCRFCQASSRIQDLPPSANTIALLRFSITICVRSTAVDEGGACDRHPRPIIQRWLINAAIQVDWNQSYAIQLENCVADETYVQCFAKRMIVGKLRAQLRFQKGDMLWSTECALGKQPYIVKILWNNSLRYKLSICRYFTT
jgi:hypothetical protein